MSVEVEATVIDAARQWRANLALVDPSPWEEALLCAVEALSTPPPPAAPEWIAIPWMAVRDNDRIRMGGAETTVLSILHEGPWQTAEPRGNVFHPKPWRHCETWVALEAWKDDPDPKERRRPVMRPQETIEVLMTAERKAVHLLAGAFGAVEDVTTEGD